MIKVCDAIMGSGKTSAAITYMNEHKDQKFIFITPYLAEARRIRNACPELHFVEPSDKLVEYKFRKVLHTAALIRLGENITTTHQSFKGYTQEMLSNITKQGYTLIIDENVEVLDEFEFHPSDLKVAIDAGYVRFENGQFELMNDEYDGEVFSDMFRMMRSRQLRIYEDEEQQTKLYWTIPPELLTSFDDVYVLTYLFEAQSLYYLTQIYQIPYVKIGVRKSEDGTYAFSDDLSYIPDYVSELRSKIHILDKDKLNLIGSDEHALSVNWFKRNGEDVRRLKNNVYNYFNNLTKDADPSELLWGTYKSGYNKVKGKGYTKSFLVFNAKATNEFRNKRYLAYIANVYVNLGQKMFFREYGIHVDDDKYALSVMVQWIWRSAIRDGKDVYLYIPSSRMRRLLEQWMDGLCKGGDGCEQ